MGDRGPSPKGTLQEYFGDKFVRFFVRWQEEGERRYKVLARCAPENYEEGKAVAKRKLAEMRVRWGTETIEDLKLLGKRSPSARGGPRSGSR